VCAFVWQEEEEQAAMQAHDQDRGNEKALFAQLKAQHGHKSHGCYHEKRHVMAELTQRHPVSPPIQQRSLQSRFRYDDIDVEPEEDPTPTRERPTGRSKGPQELSQAAVEARKELEQLGLAPEQMAAVLKMVSLAKESGAQ